MGALDALWAEVDAADGPVTVNLCGQPVTVPPVWQWPPSALDALADGEYEDWVEECLPRAAAAVWFQVDPTSEQADAFFDEWADATGQEISEIASLVGLLAEHCGPVEADLGFRGIDLRDLRRPGGGPSRLTWRRLRVFIDALPAESATKTAIRDAMPEEKLLEMAGEPPASHGPWSRTDHLMAQVIDLLKWLIFATYAVQGGHPNEPDPLPRPGVPTGPRVAADGMSAERKAEIFAHVREQHRLQQERDGVWTGR